MSSDDLLSPRTTASKGGGSGVTRFADFARNVLRGNTRMRRTPSSETSELPFVRLFVLLMSLLTGDGRNTRHRQSG